MMNFRLIFFLSFLVSSFSFANNFLSVSGCLDTNAIDYDSTATVQAEDEWGNALCTYASCEDVPSDGCMYSEAFTPWNPWFDATDCVNYGGTPCIEGSLGCLDPGAINYNSDAVVDDGTCDYSSTQDRYLVWEDEFNGSSLDGSKWVHDIGTGSQYGLTGWGNGELQYYQPENLIISDGTAKIVAREEQVNGMNYSSSKIKTNGKFSFRHGIVQAKIKTVDGQGFWPAFWMLPSDGTWPCNGEIDIMEQWGNDGNSNVTSGAAHVGICPGSSSSNGFQHNISNGSYADAFHVYEVRWYPDYIAWYVDDVKIYHVNPYMYPGYDWPFNIREWYLILNLAITSSGPNSNTEFPSQMEIDWIRVYEVDGGVYNENPQITGCLDSDAINYKSDATVQEEDEYGNILCTYASCNDVPSVGCLYADSFVAWNEGFGVDDCTNYGGTACEDHVGCMDANAIDYNANAVVQAVDEWANILCAYVSCDDVPYEGCMYSNAFSGWHEWFGASECETYGGTPCEEETATGPTEQQLSFVSGWSMFSTYMIPQEKDLGLILAPIIDKVIIAKDFSGAAYLPEYNFNGIGNVVVGQGYQIKTSVACDLTISGDYAAPEQNPISCVQGWNMIGYLRTESAPCDMVLADMVDQLIIAKNSDGLAYLPEYNFNGIGHMKPGEGYQIKITDSGTLHYHSNDDAYRFSSLELTQNHTQHFPRVAPTDHNMTVIIEDEAWDIRPEIGSEIAAYDALGTIIGSAAYSRPLSVLSIWGDDATTSSKEGMKQKEIVSFKTWTSGKTTNFSVKDWKEGSEAYQSNAINIATAIESHSELTNSTTDDRSLVKIINLLGQEIKDPKDRFDGSVLFYLYDNGSVDKVVK